MNNKLVSIIIINWNGSRWLPDCLGSIAKQDYRSYEIIFVDNASEDGSVEWIIKHHPKTKITVNKKNFGFAQANNIGYRQAQGEYILFLNNDTRVTKTFLTELVAVLKSDEQIGGAQSKIRLMDMPDTLDSEGAFLTPTGFLYHYGFGRKDEPKYDKEINLYTAKGACMIFKREVLEKIAIDGAIFDPDYFAYFEESDLCHRIWLAGYRIVYAYKSVIYHKLGATSSLMNTAFIQYHSFKNRIRTYIKNFGTSSLLICLPTHLLLCQFYAVSSCIGRKWPLAWAIERAFLWNCLHLVRTLQLRNIIQKSMRRVKDREFMHRIFRTPSLRYYLGLLKGAVNE